MREPLRQRERTFRHGTVAVSALALCAAASLFGSATARASGRSVVCGASAGACTASVGPGAVQVGAGRQGTARRRVITPRGVDGLRLGRTAPALRRHHLIGSLRRGCELIPGQRIARLRPPLRGFAIFSGPDRRLASLEIRGGAATARRIGIGSTPGEASSAYPRGRYNPPGTFEPFAEGFFWVNSPAHAKMTFVVDPDTNLISSIAVPSPNFCE